MAADGKLNQLKDVIAVYGDMIRSKLGVVSATLTTVAVRRRGAARRE